MKRKCTQIIQKHRVFIYYAVFFFQTLWMSYGYVPLHTISLWKIISRNSPIFFSDNYLYEGILATLYSALYCLNKNISKKKPNCINKTILN